MSNWPTHAGVTGSDADYPVRVSSRLQYGLHVANQKGRLSGPRIAAGATVIAGFVGVVAVAWWLIVPAADWLAHHDVGTAKGSVLINARNNARGTLLTLGAGIVALGALIFTARNFVLSRQTLELTEQGQVTDRYTKSIEQLGSDKGDIRIGGVFGLERIAHDSARDHPAIMEVLSAFIREHSSDRPTSADIQAAITVVGRLNRVHKALVINLSGADLTIANLGDAYLPGANLVGANLTAANLKGADLRSADLSGANLSGADFSKAILTEANLGQAKLYAAMLAQANLSNANLDSANLTRADLTLADLTGAYLYSADLTDARLDRANLTNVMLHQATLHDATLGRAVLVSGELVEADFTEAKLDYADLTDADFDRANLTNATFYRANLTNANLGRADVTGASFTQARWNEELIPPAGWERAAADGRLRRVEE
jgi:uncharacterized protein YjbI with pentapeptide repeats